MFNHHNFGVSSHNVNDLPTKATDGQVLSLGYSYFQTHSVIPVYRRYIMASCGLDVSIEAWLEYLLSGGFIIRLGSLGISLCLGSLGKD